MRLDKLQEEVESVEGVTLTMSDQYTVIVKGPKGEVKRLFKIKTVSMKIQDNKLVIEADKPTKREKKLANTIKAHVKNMILGVVEGHHYTLKICSGHFPMNVSISGNVISVKNFLGEKVPRKITIREGVTVKLDGDKITVEGIDKELTGQTAADLEQLTRVTNRDIRIFQDGIYIISKSNSNQD